MTARLGRPLMRRERVGSTMDEIAALARAGAPEGTAVLAEEQSAGRGRAGRSWVAPPGSAILLSILLRPALPPDRAGTLPLFFGLAVAEAIEQAAGVTPRVKWPNDVLLDGRKLAGILVAARWDGSDPVAVLGVGVNVNGSETALPDGAISLRAATGREHDRERLLALVLDRLNDAYRSWHEAGGRPDLAPWRARAVLLGEPVEVRVGDARLEGVFHDVDQDGALLLAMPDGSVERVVAGDLTRGPRPAMPGSGLRREGEGR